MKYTVIMAFPEERPVLFMTHAEADDARGAVHVAAREARQSGRDLDRWEDTVVVEGEHTDQVPEEFHGSGTVAPWLRYLRMREKEELRS